MGMIDREKVIKGLKCCSSAEECGKQCPYWNDEGACRTHLEADALALLKAQEPQVLTVEAVRRLTRIPVWLDVKSTHKDIYRGWVLAYMVQKGMGITGERLGMADPSGRMHWCKLDDYGRTWRVWDSVPTDTEKEAIPW